MRSDEPQSNGEDTKWWKNSMNPFLGLVTGGLALCTIALRPELAAIAINHRFLRFVIISLKLTGSGLVLWGVIFGLCRVYKYGRMKLEEKLGLRREISLLKEQLQWRNMDQVVAGIERAKVMWLAKAPFGLSHCGYEDDPVYLQLSADSGLQKILSQPIVQRLSHIKHLSFAYLTFRSATHTRLAHSLGACKNAQAVMGKVFRDRQVYTRDSDQPIDLTLDEHEEMDHLRLAMVAALLHDLGHGPLSHALDIHIGLGKRGKKTIKPDREFSRSYIDHYLRDVIKEAGVDPNKVIALMEEDKEALDNW